ncbi:winged helix-turn-helix transcriptional regulator, partial [Mycobacterium kansasii]
MLTQTLRALVDDGLVSRYSADTNPPRTEYRLTPAGADVAAHRDALRLLGSGQVERAGERRAPVQQERAEVLVGVEDADPADATHRVGRSLVGVGHVEAAEVEVLLGGVVLRDVVG